MRTKRAIVPSLMAVVLLAAGTAALTSDATAAPDYRCQSVRGQITLATDDTGTARGTFAGTVQAVWGDPEFSGSTVRSFVELTVTPRNGDPILLTMDLLSVNWTASGLVGGGILVEVVPPAGAFSSIAITLGPQEDRFGDPRIFTYQGERCYE